MWKEEGEGIRTRDDLLLADKSGIAAMRLSLFCVVGDFVRDDCFYIRTPVVRNPVQVTRPRDCDSLLTI